MYICTHPPPPEQIYTHSGTMYIQMKKLARAKQYICVKNDTSSHLYTILGAIIVLFVLSINASSYLLLYNKCQ
jgi:hypothetical protein